MYQYGTTPDREVLALSSNVHLRRKHVKELLSVSLLYKLYFEEKISANAIATNIAKDLNIKYGAAGVIRILRNAGFNTRSIAETCYLPSVSAQKMDILQQRYGVTNVSQIKEVKQRKADICFEKYGVSNNFKAPEIKEKIKDYYRKHYGVEYRSQASPSKPKFRISTPHALISEILTKNNIEHKNEAHGFLAFNHILGRNFSPIADIFIPTKNLVIEVFGSYWHANPKQFKADDKFNTVYGVLTAEEIWTRDKVKIEHYKKLGYKVLVIWDDEINEKQIIDKITDL